MKKIITLAILFVSAKVLAQPCVPNTNSISFNGTSNYVSLNSQNGLDITDSITIEAWVYATQFGATSAAGSIFCKHGWSGAGEAGYVLRAGGNGILSFNFAGDSLGVNASWKHVESAPGALTTGTWYHVAGTFDGTNLKIYINGMLSGTTAFTGKIVSSVFNPMISRLSDVGQFASRYWQGMIDEVRVFHRALSQTEIADSMGVHIVPSAQNALVGYWRMNDGSGTSVSDLSSGNNSGTVSGASWSASVPFNDAPSVPHISFIAGQLVTNSSPNYQWYLNGNPILVNGNSQTYLPSQNGLYTVSVSNGICTSTSPPYNLTALSVEENPFDPFISVSPNPANDFISVRLRNAAVFSDLEITDVTGKTIFNKTPITSSDFTIPVPGYSKGIYLMRFTGADGTVVKKIAVE